MPFQASLLDECAPAGPGPLGGTVRRVPLARGAWVDLRPGWLSGADALFGRLVRDVAWRAERRQMYDQVVEVPRLLAFFGEDDPLPDPVLADAKAALNAHYRDELGEDFVTVGLALYRDGRDSVAWHGDYHARDSDADTMVAIVSIGSPRALVLRPVGGGQRLRYVIGHGDLLVMGGSCQRTWQHAVPKTARPTGARISIQLRPRWVG